MSCSYRAVKCSLELAWNKDPRGPVGACTELTFKGCCISREELKQQKSNTR